MTIYIFLYFIKSSKGKSQWALYINNTLTRIDITRNRFIWAIFRIFWRFSEKGLWQLCMFPSNVLPHSAFSCESLRAECARKCAHPIVCNIYMIFQFPGFVESFFALITGIGHRSFFMNHRQMASQIEWTTKLLATFITIEIEPKKEQLDFKYIWYLSKHFTCKAKPSKGKMDRLRA